MLKSLFKAITNVTDGGPAIETETTKELILDQAIKHAKVRVHNGQVILRQWDRQEVKAVVQVRATGGYAELAGAEQNTDQFWSLQQTGTGVVFAQTQHQKFISSSTLIVNVELYIPQDVDGEIHTHNGAIEITEYQGAVEAHTHNGNIALEKVRGDIELVTHNGNIDILELDGTLRMETHNGHLRADHVTGRIKGKTHNGKIILTGAGQRGLNLETHNGIIRVNTQEEITGEWNLTTHSGDVEVSIPQATSAHLTMKTASGRIYGKALRSESTPHDAKKVIAAFGGGEHGLFMETHRGDIEVQFID